MSARAKIAPPQLDDGQATLADSLVEDWAYYGPALDSVRQRTGRTPTESLLLLMLGQLMPDDEPWRPT